MFVFFNFVYIFGAISKLFKYLLKESLNAFTFTQPDSRVSLTSKKLVLDHHSSSILC